MVTKAVRTDPGYVLFGATRRRLLAWLLGHPDEAFYLRELLRLTGTPEGGAQRELAALAAAGILTRTARGRQVYFQANDASPVFPELKSLLTKTAGIADVIRHSLESVRARIDLALIYGSAARNELRQGSDVDLLVVGDVGFGDVVGALRDGESKIGREINPTVYTPTEFQTKIRGGHHFLNAVLGEPYLIVLGNRDDLERLAGSEQVAGRAHADQARDRRPSRSRRPRSARQSGGRPKR